MKVIDERLFDPIVGQLRRATEKHQTNRAQQATKGAGGGHLEKHHPEYAELISRARQEAK